MRVGERFGDVVVVWARTIDVQRVLWLALYQRATHEEHSSSTAQYVPVGLDPRGNETKRNDQP